MRYSGCRLSRLVVMSGIQPTGCPHLGNYLGALRQWRRLEMDPAVRQLYFSVVDLHALTSTSSSAVTTSNNARRGGLKTLPKTLREEFASGTVDLHANSHLMAACLLACGLRNEEDGKSRLFLQSAVRGHTELAWVLACFCSLKRLQHLPQWKEKSNQVACDDSFVVANCGLFTYPLLQAADILLYGADLVPVGVDQLQHVELARDLANAFNQRNAQHKKKNFLVIPRPLLLGQNASDHQLANETIKPHPLARVQNLRDPSKKMSKSHPDSKGRIELWDSADEIREKIRKSLTDSDSGILTYDPQSRPGLANLMQIHYSLTQLNADPAEDVAEAIQRCILPQVQHMNKVQYKEHLADLIVEHMRPITLSLERFMQNRDFLETLLKKDADVVQAKADSTLDMVYKMLGLTK